MDIWNPPHLTFNECKQCFQEGTVLTFHPRYLERFEQYATFSTKPLRITEISNERGYDGGYDCSAMVLTVYASGALASSGYMQPDGLHADVGVPIYITMKSWLEHENKTSVPVG